MSNLNVICYDAFIKNGMAVGAIPESAPFIERISDYVRNIIMNGLQ